LGFISFVVVVYSQNGSIWISRKLKEKRRKQQDENIKHKSSIKEKVKNKDPGNNYIYH